MAIHSEPVGVDIEALDRQISWAVFNRHRTPAINSFSAPPWPPSSLPIEQQKIWHWTRWEAHCKLTGTGLLFPILPQISSHLQSYLWKDLCLSVACQAHVGAPEFLRLTLAQNAEAPFDKTLKWSTDNDGILALH